MARMWYVIGYLVSVTVMLKTAVDAVCTSPYCYKGKIISSRVSPIHLYSFQQSCNPKCLKLMCLSKMQCIVNRCVIHVLLVSYQNLLIMRMVPPNAVIL
jgi:hypothetical protein